MSKSVQTILAAFEMKMLSRILGPLCVEEQWRSRYNDEQYGMYGDLAYRAAYQARSGGLAMLYAWKRTTQPVKFFMRSTRTEEAW